MEYPRFLTPDSKPFDPVWLAKVTEEIVTREGEEGQERKYTAFYSVPVYRGIATGYAVGCCLRCFYCWSPLSRDFPERYGRFYTPGEVARRLLEAAKEGIKRWRGFGRAKVRRLRISGGEPTIGKEHLIEVLENLRGSGYLFILETNGILLGADRGYVKQLGKFKDMLYVRVSFKAASPDGFTSRTGALGEYYELPFRALEYLLLYHESLGHGRFELEKYVDRAYCRMVARELVECLGVSSEKPNSQLFRGLLAGFLSRLWGEEVKVVESKCIAKGDPYCEFEATVA